MNSKKFLEAAKAAGIETSEIVFSKSTSTSFSLFHKEIDSYSISSQSNIKCRGIYNGKLGFYKTEKLGNDAINDCIEGIKNGALIIEKTEKPIIFKGSEKYSKKNLYNKELPLVPVETKLKKLHELEDAAYAFDKRVVEVQVGYDETDGETAMSNSFGLNLKEKNNYYDYFVQVVCKDGEETKSDFAVFLNSDFTKFDAKELAKKAVTKAIAKFNGTPCETKAYKCVLNQATVSSLLTIMINSACNAENVQKNSSLLVGKLNQQVFSKKITIEERPLDKTCFFTYFDDEGVATFNKKIVDKGVLKTYLHNLETSTKDGVAPTGNARGAGSKVGIGATNLTLKPGKLSEEELFAKAENGVYITSVAGLHAGLDPHSGDFSLEAEGFHIVNGKKAGPLTLVTIGGNLYKLFNDVLAVGNNSELQLNSTTTPSILVKGIKVSAS